MHEKSRKSIYLSRAPHTPYLLTGKTHDSILCVFFFIPGGCSHVLARKILAWVDSSTGKNRCERNKDLVYWYRTLQEEAHWWGIKPMHGPAFNTQGEPLTFFYFFPLINISVFIPPLLFTSGYLSLAELFFLLRGREWWGVFNRCADRIRYWLWTWKFVSLIGAKGGQSPEAHCASYFICLHSKTTRKMIVKTRYLPTGENTFPSSDVSALLPGSMPFPIHPNAFLHLNVYPSLYSFHIAHACFLPP